MANAIERTMDAKKFKDITGTDPVNDDLDRVNCPDAGQAGHWQCGTCAHDYPRFLVDCKEPTDKPCRVANLLDGRT